MSHDEKPQTKKPTKTPAGPLIRWEQTVKELVERHESGQLEVMTGPRYLTLSEQSALLTFAAHTLAKETAQ